MVLYIRFTIIIKTVLSLAIGKAAFAELETVVSTQYDLKSLTSYQRGITGTRRELLEEASLKSRRGSLPTCNPNVNKSLSPSQIIGFELTQGQTLSLGDTAFILARFPDEVCYIPDPGDIPNQACTPLLFLNVVAGGQDYVVLPAEPRASDVEAQYKVDFSDQAELWTASGALAQYWVFKGYVSPGISCTGVRALFMVIPEGCNSAKASFQDALLFPPGFMIPTGVKFDTNAPIIQSVFSSEKSGNYTAGHQIDIIVEFSKDVKFSELPDQYSQVYLDAKANSTMLYGVPYIELNSGAFVALRGYENTADLSRLSFLYLVGTGEETPPGLQLDIAPNTTIQLNGGQISGNSNNLDADLTTMPAYGQSGEPLSAPAE